MDMQMDKGHIMIIIARKGLRCVSFNLKIGANHSESYFAFFRFAMNGIAKISCFG
jgi:hypothetical protein